MNKPIFGQAVLRIMAILALAGLLVMVVMAYLPSAMGQLSSAILQVVLQLFIATPAIYLLVIRPLMQEKDLLSQELEKVSHADPLTGLPNRRVMLNCMEKALAECARHNINAALMQVDIDDFRGINKKYGRDAGDVVLVEMSKRLVAGMRKEDVVSRVGGDEFLVLIRQLNDDVDKAAVEARAFAQKLQQHLLEPIDYHGRSIQVPTSIGINFLNGDTTTIESAIRKARIAMDYARQEDGGGIAFYVPSSMNI